MKAAAYYRVSSQTQQERESIDTQKDILRPWLEEKGSEYTEFQDDGISGEEIEKRPGFSNLLARLDTGEFEALVVFQTNRIGRFKAPLDRARVMTVLLSNSISVYTYDGVDEEYYDPQRPEVMLDLEEELLDARRSNLKHAKATKAGQNRVRRLGRFASGGVPYGIRWNGESKKYEIDEEEYGTLKEIVRLLQSGIGLHQTVEILNSDLSKYRPRKAKIWKTATLWGMLNKRDFLFTGVKIENQMDKNRRQKPQSEWITVDTGIKLFSEEEIRRVRREMSLRRKRRTNSKESLFVPENFLLDGLLECGECRANLGKHAMKPNGTKVYRYYKCHNRDKGNCTFKYVHADDLDLAVWQSFVATFSDPEKLQKAIVAEEFMPKSKRRDLEALVKKARQDLAGIAGKQERLTELYVDGDIDKKTYQEKKTELERAKEEAKATWRKAEHSLAEPDKLMRAIKAATKAMSTLVRGIVVDKPFIKKAEELAREGDWYEKELALRIRRKTRFQSEQTLESEGVEMSDDLKKLIFQQKREILGKFIAAGGEIRVWNKEMFEITGTLPSLDAPGGADPSGLSSDYNFINSGLSA